jgi:hypothetical protein
VLGAELEQARGLKSGQQLELYALLGWATGKRQLQGDFDYALKVCSSCAENAPLPSARFIAISLLSDIASRTPLGKEGNAMLERISFEVLPALLKAETAPGAKSRGVANEELLGAIMEAQLTILEKLWSDSFFQAANREVYTLEALGMHNNQGILARSNMDSVFGGTVRNGLNDVKIREPMYSGIMSRYLELCVNGEPAQQLEAINFLAKSFERTDNLAFRNEFRDRISRAFSLAEAQHSSGEGAAASPIVGRIAEIRETQWWAGFVTVEVSFTAAGKSVQKNGGNGAQKTSNNGAPAPQGTRLPAQKR